MEVKKMSWMVTENNSFCEVAPVSDDNGGFVETCIHALTTTTIDNVLSPGLPDIPEFSGPLDSIVDNLATKTCIIHAPAENPGNVALAKWRFLVRDSRRAGCFVGVWAIAKVETK